ITDVHKNVEDFFYINIDRSTKQSRNYFRIVPPSEEIPLFSNYVTSTDSFRIEHQDTSLKKLIVHYYHRNFPMAPPPFSFDYYELLNYNPDSTFTIEINEGRIFSFPAEGFYHIQKDTSVKSGFTIYRFHPDFPDLTSPEELLEPIRYLTSRKEFDEMRS